MGKNLSIQFFGWYGAIALLSAYALVSFSVLDAGGVFYQLLNISGSLGIIAVSWHKFSKGDRRSYQPALLNLVWAMIGLLALLKIFF